MIKLLGKIQENLLLHRARQSLSAFKLASANIKVGGTGLLFNESNELVKAVYIVSLTNMDGLEIMKYSTMQKIDFGDVPPVTIDRITEKLFRMKPEKQQSNYILGVTIDG